MTKKTKTILCPLCKGLPRRFVPVPFHAIGRLTGSELATYVSVRSFKNSSTGKCYPSMQTIAKRAGYSRKTVQAAKQSLRDHGLLEWEVRGRKHVYWFPEDREDRDQTIPNLVKGCKIRPP